MTDELIEQIKRDREAGTPGKWHVEYKHGNTRLIMKDHPDPCQMCDETYYPWVPENLNDWERFARVPEMEARILADAKVIEAAEEMIHRMGEDLAGMSGVHVSEKARAALRRRVEDFRAFRKAQEGRDD